MTKARVNADNASADIQGVTAGTGLTGGGTSGTVTLTNDMATAIDAKGDLVVGTGADTYDNLAVGNNGETLLADSSTSTGLRWGVLPIVNGTTGTLTETRGGTNQNTYATGDLLYASASNTLAKRSVGTTGQVLTVSGGVPTWATPSAPATNKTFSLLSSAAPSGQTYTVSGLSGYDIIMVVVNGLSANGDWQCGFRINTDTGSNYSSYGLLTVAQAGYSSAIFRNINFVGQTYFPCVDSAQASSQADVCFMIFGANSTGPKIVQFNNGQGTQVASLGTYQGMGVYSGGSVVSSISLRQLTASNTWDNGTVNVYGAI